MPGVWPEVAFGDVFDISSSKRVLEKQWTTVGVPFYRAREIVKLSRDGRVDNELFISEELYGELKARSDVPTPGDLVVSAVGTLGACYVVRPADRFYFKDASVLLFKPKRGVDSRFMWHAFQTEAIQKQIHAGSGSTVGTYTISRAKQTKLHLPPLPEQRRIAAILDKADALRAKRREAITKLDQLLQSVFLDMFGDPATNPKNWPMVPFGRVTDSRLGKMLDKRTSQGKDMKPYLANLNVQWGRFELGSLRLMNFNPEEQREFSLRDGDLLMCEGGQPGRCAIWRGQVADCYYQKALHRIRCREDACVPEYLQWLFWFLSRAGSFRSSVASATIAHLPGVKLKKMLIPLPPLEKQLKFAKFFRANEGSAAVNSSALEMSDFFFSSLQKKVFEGTL